MTAATLQRTPARHLRTLGLALALLILIVVVLFPVLWLARMSIIPASLMIEFPPALLFEPDFGSYRQVLQNADFIKYMLNSVIAALASTLLALTLGLPTAYSFTRFRFRGRNAMSLSVLILHVMPPIALILPIYLIFARLRLLDTLPGLVISHTLLTLPLAIWLLRGFIVRLPAELEDAALIDGCTRLGMIVRILVPVLAPGISATAVLTFLYSWNDYIYALTLTGIESRTLPVLLTGFVTDRVVYWDQLASAGMLVLVPPLVFGVLAQRYLISGLSAGAVK